jgi:hypothetical protein
LRPSKVCWVKDLAGLRPEDAYCRMVLVGCAVMPHAPMILNPDIEEALSLEGLRELNEACCKISAAVRERRPHLVLLCTPHGVNVEGYDFQPAFVKTRKHRSHASVSSR